MQSISDYKRVEFELHEYLVQLRDMLVLLKGSEAFLDKIEADIEYIKSKRFQAAVIGEFKRGKSSLINALLGADILPSDIEPTTATINRITYGSKSSATIYYKDGISQTIDIHRLSEYVTKLTAASGEMAAQVKEARITYPVEICRNNIEIIDTPGLNDDEHMTEVTLDMVNSIDAAIVTISAVSPVSSTEQSLISQLIKRENVGCILFVITFIDQIDEEDRERLLHSIRQRICVDS
jgi:small GTP-binding protein